MITYSNTMDDSELKEKFSQILKKANDLGLTKDQLSRLDCVKSLRCRRFSLSRYVRTVLVWIQTHSLQVSAVVVLTLALLIGITSADWPVSKRTLVEVYFKWYNIPIEDEPCLFINEYDISEYMRPPINCEICMDVTEVEHVAGIRPGEFESKYAYSGRPVIIVDGMESWTAVGKFNFEFFKSIYGKDSMTLSGGIVNQCQFFPYKTNFQSLGEVFNMSMDQASMKDGTKPWYVGWSNCDPEAARILREHYSRPYFIPEISESSKTDWIFMGSPGYGAHLHIDNVRNPSWQAQITGAKKWILEPPPECYLVCKQRIEVIVQPGEIIVVDTNRWFHSTLVVSEDMSITIGSEYD